jgi:hypothetical protein
MDPSQKVANETQFHRRPEMAGSFPPIFRPQKPSSRPDEYPDCGSINSCGMIETGKPSLDITQRLERRLAEFNTSSNLFKRWLLEIVSCLVSATCLGVVIIIYAYYKDKPMVTFGNLSTLTNVLGKVATAALIIPTTEALGQLKWNWFSESNAVWDFEIFDKATRGPWGAAMLLYRTRGRSLAALGAVLILLLLAIDSFLQQVIDYPTRWTVQSGDAEVRTIVRYEPGEIQEFRESMELQLDDVNTKSLLEKYFYGYGTQPAQFTGVSRTTTKSEVPYVSAEMTYSSSRFNFQSAIAYTSCAANQTCRTSFRQRDAVLTCVL